jgi:hypothetical protein
MADINKKLKFQRIPPPNENKFFDWRERGEKDEFIRFGEDNLFPQTTIEIYNKSSIHAAAVNAIVQGIIGKGLTSDDESNLKRANASNETWNDIYEKVALDYKLHGSFALEVIWSRDRQTIDVHHVDFSYLRAKEKDHRGKCPGYYISSKWGKIGRSRTVLSEDEALYLPTYDPSKKEDQPHQIYVHKNYRPGQMYYPLPDYVGAYRVIELDTEIDNFHTVNIKNGLAPSLSITTFTNGSDDQLRDIEAQLNANYAGSENAGSLMYIDVDSPENAPQIVPIPQNGADGYYVAINDMVVQKILTAHRITSPMILGIKTEGQLGGRSEVVDAYLLFQNNVIVPYQQDILSSLEGLLQINYPDCVLGVEQKKLYDDGTEEEEIITDTDTTAQEESDIEQPENLA